MPSSSSYSSILDSERISDKSCSAGSSTILSSFSIVWTTSEDGGGGFKYNHPIKIKPITKNPINELTSILLSYIY